MSLKNYENILCVIPARGGSQGIIDKNLQLVGGIPLVEHSIVHALDAGLMPEHIWVSSDNEDILNIALRNRVIADERPPGISGANSSTEETLLYVLNIHIAYCKHHNIQPCEHVLLLQPTSPIRFQNTITRFIEFYLQGNYDSALTTTKFHNFFWQIQGDKFVSTYDPDNRPMRQKITEQEYLHLDNGNAYLTSRKVLEEKKCRLGTNVGVFPISELEGMQIDTPEDLEIFRAIFSGGILEKIGLQ